MPTKSRKPAERTTARVARIRNEALALATAGQPDLAAKLLKKHYIAPLPPTAIGPPSGGKGGRPRTGNKSLSINPGDPTGKEPGASHAHLDHAYNRFLEGIEEPELLTALALNPQQKYNDALQLLTSAVDKRISRRGTGKPGEWSTAALLKHAGVTLGELMDVYGRYRVSCAVRIAIDRSPKIIQHAADDAENRAVVCPRCDGLGTLDLSDPTAEPEPSWKNRSRSKPQPLAAGKLRTCPECKGTGEVTQSGDNEARKLVLEVAGIAGKKGPVVDARSVHYGNGTFSVESLVRSMEEGEEPLKLPPASTPVADVEKLPIIEGEETE